MTNLECLLALVFPPPIHKEPSGCIVADGFVVDPSTGVVLGPYICIQDQDYTKQPIFIYNRSVRFEDLVWRSKVPGHCIKDVLTLFSALEEVWEAHKSSFDRKYFLTQRLLCQQLCFIVGCECSIKGRPIRDKRRYKKQIVIFEQLLRLFSESKNKCRLPSSLALKVNNTILNQSLSPP